MEKKASVKSVAKGAIFYFFGLVFIALGQNISKMSSLGISAVASIPRACEIIFGATLGTTTIALYFILIVIQVLILRKKFKFRYLLGIFVSLAFGYLIDFLGIDPKAFGHLLINFPRPNGYIMRAIYSLISIILIGIGVFAYLVPNWVPMPAEGVAGAISEVTGKQFGNCKTIVDCSLIAIALILQMVFLGGFESFVGENVVVREGTVATAILVGQVVKLLNKITGDSLKNWINK